MKIRILGSGTGIAYGYVGTRISGDLTQGIKGCSRSPNFIERSGIDCGGGNKSNGNWHCKVQELQKRFSPFVPVLSAGWS
jgi:hypothetical protein